MALIDLIFSIPKKNSKGIISINASGKENPQWNPDGILSLEHHMSSVISQSPIENGSNISDHVILDNRKLTLEGVITNTPLEITQSVINTAATAIGNPIPTLVGASTIGLLISEDSRNRMQDAFKYLESIWKDRLPFTMVTGFKRYEKVLITDLRIPETNVREMRFNISLEQVALADTIMIEVPRTTVDKSIETTATSTVSEGKKELQEPTEEVKEKGSILYRKFIGGEQILPPFF